MIPSSLLQAAQQASWLEVEQRGRVARSPRRREEFARELLGDTPAALGRCFNVGMRLLARARQSCGRAGVMWDAGMFSMYGSGRTCRVAAVADSRSRTFRLLSAARPTLDPELAPLVE